MRTKGKLVVGAIAAAAVAVAIIIAQGANLQKPADIVQQEPSRQTAIITRGLSGIFWRREIFQPNQTCK